MEKASGGHARTRTAETPKGNNPSYVDKDSRQAIYCLKFNGEETWYTAAEHAIAAYERAVGSEAELWVGRSPIDMWKIRG